MSTINANTVITQSYINSASWPITISGGLSISPVLVSFGETLSITGDNTRYFIIGSQYITIDGSFNNVYLSNISNHKGLIQNGTGQYTFTQGTGSWAPEYTVEKNGFSNTTLKNINLNISGGCLISEYAGFLCQAYYSRGAINNSITRCNTIREDFFYQSDAATNFGGIAGAYSSFSGGKLSITQCFTTVDIYGGGGCITGSFTGYGGNTFIGNCYSTGAIGYYSSGGIIGRSSPGPGGVVIVESCASYGSISYGQNAGGIAGEGTGASSANNSCVLRNCFSTSDANGTSTTGSGIMGPSSSTTATLRTNLYVANGTWSDSAAITALTAAIIANVWVDVSSSATNVPYRHLSAQPLSSSASTLYSPNIISSRIRPILSSPAAIPGSSYTYSIVATSGTLPTSISINSSTGVITCGGTNAFNCNVRVLAQLSNTSYLTYGYTFGNVQISSTVYTRPAITCICPDYSNNRLFVATQGNTVGGNAVGTTAVLSNGLAVLDLNNNTWSNINLNTSIAGNVLTMSIYGSNLVVGGSFYNVNSNSTLDYVFKYNTITNTILPLPSSSAETVGNGVSTNNVSQRHGVSSSAITENGTLYCHGRFGTTASVVSSGASLFPYYDFTSQILYKQYASVTTTDGIQCFYQANSTDLYVGGLISNIGGTLVSHFARIDTTTKTATSLGTFAGGSPVGQVTVFVFNPTENVLYLFGQFGTINSKTVNKIAGYNVVTNTFIDLSNGVNNAPINDADIDISNQKIFIVGQFGQVLNSGVQSALNTYGFAVYDITTKTMLKPVSSPHMSVGVSHLLCKFNPNNGLFYIVTGLLTNVAPNRHALYSYNDIADTYVSITGTNSLATSANGTLAFNSMVYCSYNNSLYIGGVFNTCTGGGTSIPCNNILRYDITNNTFSALDLSGSVNGFTVGVQCMYFDPSENMLYVGGGFNYVAGQKITNYAKYDVVSQTWSSIWPSKYSLIPADEQTIVSGAYVSGSQKVRPGFRMHIYNNGTSNQTMYMSSYTFGVDASNNFNTFAKIEL